MGTRVSMSAAALAAVVGPTIVIGVTGPVAAESGPGVPSPEARYCSTRMLAPEEIKAGATSTITCTTTFAGSLAIQGITVDADSKPGKISVGGHPAYDSSGLVAIHYDGNGATGAYLSVAGTVCNGGGIVILPEDWWNDRISTTRHQACSNIKHFEHPDFSGNTETTNQPSGYYQTLGPTLNNQVSGIKYFGPNN